MYSYEPINSAYYQMRNVSYGNSKKIRFEGGYVYAIAVFTSLVLFAVLGAALSFVLPAISLGQTTIVPSENLVLFIGAGAVLGLIIGLIIAAVKCNNLSSLEELSENAFSEVRNVLPVGNILYDQHGYPLSVITPGRAVLCESRVELHDRYAVAFFGEYLGNKKGRLFLTTEALEFYDDDPVKNAHRNFLINIQDIAYVKSGCILRNRVKVYSRSGKYRFRVPLGSSREWVMVIRQALQYGSRSFGPVHPNCM